MGWSEHLRPWVKAGRKRGSRWVRFADTVRLLPSAEGRARLWTRIVHRSQVHQTSADTADERYPVLFDLAARLTPDARRILSFGCSTGEELFAIRKRFPNAEIVGVEINPRSRSMAAERTFSDRRTSVVGPSGMRGQFDLIFALAVLQREPYMVAEAAMNDLGGHYPFDRFDVAVRELASMLLPGGYFCVTNAHYPVELSSAADQLGPVPFAPQMTPPMFGRDSRLLGPATARTMFRKRG